MRRVLMRLYRERRRVAVITPLIFLGWVLLLLTTPMTEEGVGKLLGTCLALTGGFVLFLTLTALLVPKIRWLAETTAIWLFLGGPLVALRDSLGMFEPGFVIGAIAVCALASTAYTCGCSDRFLAMRPRALRSTAKSRLPPEHLWPFLVVPPESDPVFRDPTTMAIEWIELGHSYRVTKNLGGIAKFDQINTITICNPPTRYVYRAMFPDMRQEEQGQSCEVDLRLIPKAQGTRLEACRDFDRLTIRAWLFLWIDDQCGKADDALILRAERVRQGAECS